MSQPHPVRPRREQARRPGPVAGLFSRRGFNIDSLAVGPTEHAEISRMTIVVNVEDSPLEQVTKQLNKLVKVIKIVELDAARRRCSASCCWSRSRPTPRPAARCSRPSSCSGPRSSTSPPDAVTIEVDRQRRQARGAAARARALRHPRARPVRHGRHRPRLPLDHRPDACARRRTRRRRQPA